jgi:hypothetical protein
MPVIDRIETVEDRTVYPKVTATGWRLAAVPITAPVQAADTPTDRVIPVNRQALELFRRCGIKPPQEGSYSIAEVDALLAAAPISLSDRMAVKNHLKDYGLLSLGRPVDTR